MNANAERRISSDVVAQEQTLIRITAFPSQIELPTQHSPLA
jgi:hypothetical protein